ncbi:MAG: SMC family ATPase [Clostridium sp.]|nr:SMC family ATPase [Clostridium sp.]MCM1547215.1 SMC family ATPase [Ruminococcus sp.]
MKPLKLTMSAFGPFADVTQIDFEKIGENGIFLITGDTGSGKTTIFDAISFALYGEPSGGRERRSGTSFRSDFAPLTAETYVQFRFEQHGKIYEIKRSPAYERAYKNGREGTTASLPTRELHDISNDATYTSDDEVKSKIEEIIGLDAMHFSQTVMIAQGEFRKIISADSSSRKQIFQRLFNTGIYERFQLELKDMYSSLESNVKMLNSKIISEMSRGKADDSMLDGVDISDPVCSEEYLKRLSEYHKECGEKLDKLEEERKKTAAEAEALTADIAECRELNKKISELSSKREEMKKLTANEEYIRTSKEKLKNAEKTSGIYPLQKLTEEKRVSAEKKAEESKLTKAKKAQHEIKLKESAAKLESAQKAAESIDGLKKRYTILENTLPLFDKLEKVQDSHKRLCGKLVKLKAENSVTDKAYREAFDRFIYGQAGILAKELLENEPCPVCGSLHHPSPAKAADNIPTQEEIDELKKSAAESLDLYIKCSEECHALKKAEEELLENELLKKSNIRAVKTKLREIRSEITDIENDLKKALDFHTDCQREFDRLTERAEVLENESQILEEESKKLYGEFENALAAQGFESMERYEAAKLSPDEIRQTRKEIEKYRTEHKLAEASIKELETSVNGKTAVNIEEKEIKKSELSKQTEQYAETISQIKTRREINSEVIGSLEKLNKKVGNAREEWGMIADIYKTVSGQKGGGTAKLKFEAYVQQYYFKRVVACANKRLRLMTEDCFVLRCRDTAKNLKQQSGLDLEVLDRNTGHWRDISTLSGGESFMASLSLALGLSDVVQENNGGIRLDSMFIDEGFGTLDDNSLRQAVSLLEKLSDGKRLIGIISHVNELKSRIDKKIVVTKTPNGSEIDIKL